jgi:hypothetical protein
MYCTTVLALIDVAACCSETGLMESRCVDV